MHSGSAIGLGRSGVTAIVVTYNRKELLANCLTSLAKQTHAIDYIIVVDNGSDDGTHESLCRAGWLASSTFSYLKLPENTGGAGGFHAGLELALGRQFGWAWLMDDDAAPHQSALEEIFKLHPNPLHVYGSLATCGAYTSWTTTLLDEDGGSVDFVSDVPAQARVQSLPFLGFLVHRNLVERIGLPDSDYFIAADDVEYCLRAQRAGANIFVAGKSLIKHPKSERYLAKLPGRNLVCLRLAPWKRYYDTRNRLLIARKYYGARMLTQTIPGSFVRLCAALIYEPCKLAQLWAFIAGFIDGLLGIKGRRHNWWHIRN